ncbi:DUF4401 domain-containing protein [Pontibacter sp. H249]|uniref:DUF4401 domain-containing protein n=1 Tax=Pontibacter sp. H249 TaxID=3133420 RepID=UPI0030BD8CDA
MANTNQLDALLHGIAQEQGEGFTFDRASIEQEAQQNSLRISQLAVKVLVILGGFLGASTFLGFLVAAGLYNSPIAMATLGIILLAGAEWLIRNKKESTADSVGVSFNIIGYILLAVGVGQLVEEVMDSGTVVALVMACAATLLILFSHSGICTFLAVLVLNGSLLGLLFIHKIYNGAHALIILQGAILIFMSLNEAKLIAASAKLNTKYGPIRMGVIFSLVITLGLFVHQKFLSSAIGYFWVSGLFLSGCLIYLLHRVLQNTDITNIKTKAAFYTCCLLILTPTVVAPSVPGALLILLSSFYIGHKPGFWVGLLALAYFVILYYYDLNLTLLAKSGVLVASGLFFLGGFVLLNRYLKSYAN